jgi:hypothetical protein
VSVPELRRLPQDGANWKKAEDVLQKLLTHPGFSTEFSTVSVESREAVGGT